MCVCVGGLAVGLRVVAAVVLMVVCVCVCWSWGGGGHFGCMHNEIPRVIPPVCQGPVLKQISRGWRR